MKDMKQRCTICKKEVENPYNGKNYLCDFHRKNYRKKWGKINKEKISIARKKYQHKVKYEALNFYSQGTLRCACCGEDEFDFLTIDHINGNGGKHKKSIRGRLSVWLRQKNYPEGFQVLCFNCNCGKSVNGKNVCPHKIKNIHALSDILSADEKLLEELNKEV